MTCEDKCSGGTYEDTDKKECLYTSTTAPLLSTLITHTDLTREKKVGGHLNVGGRLCTVLPL